MWEYDKRAVGERLRKQRKAMDMTQDSLAEKLGKSTKFIADVERGSCGMSIDTLLVMCESLNMSPNTVLLGHIDGDGRSLPDIGAMLDHATLYQKEKIINIIKIILDD